MVHKDISSPLADVTLDSYNVKFSSPLTTLPHIPSFIWISVTFPQSDAQTPGREHHHSHHRACDENLITASLTVVDFISTVSL